MIYSAAQSDVVNIAKAGGMYRPRIDEDGDAVWSYDYQEDSQDRLTAMLDGGDHQDDHVRGDRRTYRWHKHLPRAAILKVVREGGHRRPARSQYHT